MNRAIEAAGTDTVARMKAAIEGLVEYLAGHTGEARILIEESSGLSPLLYRIRCEVLALHTREVESGLKALGVAEAEITARCWTGAVHHAILWWIEQPPAGRQPPQDLALAVSEFVLRGIGHGPAFDGKP